MALSYKARRRWSLLILLVGLPLYIIVALNVIALFERPSILLELAIYPVLYYYLKRPHLDPSLEPTSEELLHETH